MTQPSKPYEVTICVLHRYECLFDDEMLANTGDKIKVHGCVLMKCKYERGHEISDNGSYVNCTFTPTCRTGVEEMIKEDLVYLVSIVNVDTHNVCYVCDTEEKAMGMFEELRKECIEEHEEAIQHYCKDAALMYLIPREHEKIAFLKTTKSGDVPPWCCDRPAIEVFPFMRSRRDIPSSKELIQLATTDFKNREERHHRHDQASWTSGWITGFLSERKLNWSKVLREKVRKEVLGSFKGFIDAYRRQDEDGHDYVSVIALENHIDYLMEKKK